jgi:ABC-type transport system involved in cytochrome c biogenesis permease subunit
MQDSSQAVGIIAAIFAVYAVVILVALIAVIVPFWFILKKAGFSPWLSLLNLVPLGALILLYVLAFAEWKVIPAPVQAWIPPTMPPPQV